MKTFIKRLATSCLLMATCFATAIAQTTVTHVVGKNETLQTIAQRYDTTKDEIVSLNPEAAQYIYVGMELQISVKEIKAEQEIATAKPTPNKAETKIDPVAEAKAAEPESRTLYVDNNTTTDTVKPAATENIEKPSKLNFAFEIGWGFLKKNETLGDKDHRTSSAYHASMGITYDIVPNFHVGARLGYRNSHIPVFDRVNYDSHYITLPIEIGYFINHNRKWGVIPFAGINANLCVAAKYDSNNRDYDYIEDVDLEGEGKFGVEARVGLRLILWGFAITGSYNIPLNDDQKDFFHPKSYPEVSIGWTI